MVIVKCKKCGSASLKIFNSCQFKCNACGSILDLPNVDIVEIEDAKKVETPKWEYKKRF